MKLYYDSNKIKLRSHKYTAKVYLAIELLHDRFNNEDFLKAIENKTHWTYSDKTGKEIADIIRNSNVLAEVYGYRPKWRWSKAVAKSYPGSDRVGLNTRKLGRPVEAIAGTLAHEVLHILGFDHGGNKLAGKGDSVNYYVGSMVKNWRD